jgi:IMP dehydrogenase
MGRRSPIGRGTGPEPWYLHGMQFLHPERDETLELALDDVFLVPDYFDGTSRLDVDLRPVDFPGGAHPLVSANMNAVTGKRMAETMARLGGLGVLPQDMEIETAGRIIGHIRAADPRYDTPLSVSPRATMRDVLGIIRKRAHDMVIARSASSPTPTCATAISTPRSVRSCPRAW